MRHEVVSRSQGLEAGDAIDSDDEDTYQEGTRHHCGICIYFILFCFALFHLFMKSYLMNAIMI